MTNKELVSVEHRQPKLKEEEDWIGKKNQVEKRSTLNREGARMLL